MATVGNEIRSAHGRPEPARRRPATTGATGLLASGGGDGTVRLWDPATGEAVQVLTGHTGWVLSVAFSPDGSMLASGGGDGTVRLWDPATGQAVQVLTGHTSSVTSVAFSPDGGMLATSSSNHAVRLWESNSGRAVTMMRADSAVANCVWAVDGCSLFVGGEAGLFGYDLEGGNAR